MATTPMEQMFLVESNFKLNLVLTKAVWRDLPREREVLKCGPVQEVNWAWARIATATYGRHPPIGVVERGRPV